MSAIIVVSSVVIGVAVGVAFGWRGRGAWDGERRLLAVLSPVDEPEVTLVMRSGRPGCVLIVTEGACVGACEGGYRSEAVHRPEHEALDNCLIARVDPDIAVWIDPSWARLDHREYGQCCEL